MLVEEEAAGRQLVHKEAGSTWQHPSPSHREVAAGAMRQGKEENQLWPCCTGLRLGWWSPVQQPSCTEQQWCLSFPGMHSVEDLSRLCNLPEGSQWRTVAALRAACGWCGGNNRRMRCKVRTSCEPCVTEGVQSTASSLAFAGHSYCGLGQCFVSVSPSCNTLATVYLPALREAVKMAIFLPALRYPVSLQKYLAFKTST